MKSSSPLANPSILLLSVAALLCSSCNDRANENYDTPPRSGYPGAAMPVTPAPHPTYGDAAYEQQNVGQPGMLNPTIPSMPVDPGATAVAGSVTGGTPVNPPNANGSRDHYVGPGDSLWKISRLYKVPVESIKQANGMTNDTVVLGKKLIIPPQ